MVLSVASYMYGTLRSISDYLYVYVVAHMIHAFNSRTHIIHAFHSHSSLHHDPHTLSLCKEPSTVLQYLVYSRMCCVGQASLCSLPYSAHIYCGRIGIHAGTTITVRNRLTLDQCIGSRAIGGVGPSKKLSSHSLSPKLSASAWSACLSREAAFCVAGWPMP